MKDACRNKQAKRRNVFLEKIIFSDTKKHEEAKIHAAENNYTVTKKHAKTKKNLQPQRRIHTTTKVGESCMQKQRSIKTQKQL